MQTLNFLTWLDVTLMCDTMYSKGHYHTNEKSQLISSEKPWMLLEKYKEPLPSNCAVIFVDDWDSLAESILYVNINKSRIRVSFLMTLPMNSSKTLEMSWSPPDHDVHIVQIDVDMHIKGHQKLTPFIKNGQAKKRHVTVSYALIVLYVNQGGDNPEGADIELVKTLSKSLNFTYELHYAKYFYDLIQHVATGASDFSISHAAIAEHRYNYGLDIMTLLMRKYVLTQKYPNRINSINTATQPFTMHVWVSVFFSIILIYFILAIMNRWYKEGKERVAFKDITLSFIPLVSQSIPHGWYRSYLTNNLSYILMFIWLLLGSLLSQAYESNLLANLVKVEREKQPKNLQDVLESKMSLHLLKNSAIPIFLRDSPLEIHRKIYEENVIKRSGFYQSSLMPPPDVVKKVLSGEAFVVQFEDGLAAHKHQVHHLKEEVASGPAGYYFRLHLPIGNEIKDAILSFSDTGITQKIKDATSWKLSKPWRDMKRDARDEGPVTIGLNHILPVMAILAIGLFISLMCNFIQLRSAPEITK